MPERHLLMLLWASRRTLQPGLKLLIERSTHRILGAHILGEEASDMIHLFIAMIKMQGRLEDLLDMIFIHPALPELARDAARAAQAELKNGP